MSLVHPVTTFSQVETSPPMRLRVPSAVYNDVSPSFSLSGAHVVLERRWKIRTRANDVGDRRTGTTLLGSREKTEQAGRPLPWCRKEEGKMPIVYREIISLARDDVTRRRIFESERKYLSEFNGDIWQSLFFHFLRILNNASGVQFYWKLV
jgi:hypothetical protein